MLLSSRYAMQKGRIERRGNCWLLRYYVPVLNEKTGKVEGKPASKKLATFSKGGYDSEKKVRPLADRLEALNAADVSAALAVRGAAR
jgi:hypothetical protein